MKTKMFQNTNITGKNLLRKSFVSLQLCFFLCTTTTIYLFKRLKISKIPPPPSKLKSCVPFLIILISNVVICDFVTTIIIIRRTKMKTQLCKITLLLCSKPLFATKIVIVTFTIYLQSYSVREIHHY